VTKNSWDRSPRILIIQSSFEQWRDLEGAEPAPPPPLGDGLTPLLKVMLANDRSIVKHGTQNIQNDCHQWLSDSFRGHQIRFWPGLCPGPHWGSLQRSPDHLAGLRGPTSNGKERGGRGERERKRRQEGDRPPFRKFLDPPLLKVWIFATNVMMFVASVSYFIHNLSAVFFSRVRIEFVPRTFNNFFDNSNHRHCH